MRLSQGVGGQGVCGLDQERVDEGLRQVAAQLALDDVELLGEQARRSERTPVALEPADRAIGVTLLVGSQREVEAAQQEGPLGLGQRSGVGAGTGRRSRPR